MAVSLMEWGIYSRGRWTAHGPAFRPSVCVPFHFPAATRASKFIEDLNFGFDFSGTRNVRHWARKAAFDRRRRLPNRALRCGSCASPSPGYPMECSIFRGTHTVLGAGGMKGGSLGFNGDFSVKCSPSGGFLLAPLYPVRRNKSLQSKRIVNRQHLGGIELRGDVSLSPKPWGVNGAWSEVWQRISHPTYLRRRSKQHLPQHKPSSQKLP